MSAVRLSSKYQVVIPPDKVHDAFGGVNKAADLSGVMKSLIAIKERYGG